MSVTFPDPDTLGDEKKFTYTTDNGLVIEYEWDGEKWISGKITRVEDYYYWERNGTELNPTTAGDDVFTSGSVKVGGTTAAPKIELKADGSAEFAGDIGIGGTLPSAPNISLNADGTASFKSQAVNIDSSGRLGLGTSAPGAPLHVMSTATAGGNIANFDDSGSGATGRLQISTTGGTGGSGIRLAAINRATLQLGGAAASVLAVDIPNTRVGINTETPGSVLSLGSSADAQKLLIFDDGPSSYIRYGFGVQPDEMRTFAAGSAALTFGHVSSFNGTTYSEKVRIESAGDVKIGGTLPSAPKISLNANGTAEFTGDVKVGFQAGRDVTIKSTDVDDQIVINTAYVGGDPSSRVFLKCSHNSTEKIRLTHDGGAEFTGDIGIGGTLPSAPNIELNADGTGIFASLAGNGIANVGVDNDGKLIIRAEPFTWDANDDSYTQVPVADRDINVHARMRRCLVTDAGAVTYLDADDSTKLAGDWIRLCETTELDTEYTGTHGTEVQNRLLRALAPAWSAGTFTKGALVTYGGSVWECLAATTTATPAAGTAAATLDGTAGQVMVEIPTFSVYHRGDVVGEHCRHQWAVSLGAAQGGGYVTHPAFVKPDGSIRKAIYIGAYQGTGASGNGSASGVNNTTNLTRVACRTACAGRGTGWHQLGYAEYNALQLLLLTEYQDLDSQRALGNGASGGGTSVVNTGLSNARGNRSENVHTPAGANTDYVSYRGVENIYGRAWQWTDGINVNERTIYVCTDPSKWADDTAADYDAVGVVPAVDGSYIRDVFSAGTYLLPSSVKGGSGTTYVGDALWTSSGWRGAYVGGHANYVARVGALCVSLIAGPSEQSPLYAGRLAFAV